MAHSPLYYPNLQPAETVTSLQVPDTIPSFLAGILGHQAIGSIADPIRESSTKQMLNLPTEHIRNRSKFKLPFGNMYAYEADRFNKGESTIFTPKKQRIAGGKHKPSMLENLMWWGDPHNIRKSPLPGITKAMRPTGLALAAFSPWDAGSYLGAGIASAPSLMSAIREGVIGFRSAGPGSLNAADYQDALLNKGLPRLSTGKRLGNAFRAGGRSLLGASLPWLLATVRDSITKD